MSMKRKTLKKRWETFSSAKVAPYVFVLPFLLTFVIFFIYPIISSVMTSFQNVHWELPNGLAWRTINGLPRVPNFPPRSVIPFVYGHYDSLDDSFPAFVCGNAQQQVNERRDLFPCRPLHADPLQCRRSWHDLSFYVQ